MEPNPYQSPSTADDRQENRRYRPPWGKEKINWAKGCGVAFLAAMVTPVVIGILIWLWMLVDMVLLPAFFGQPK